MEKLILVIDYTRTRKKACRKKWKINLDIAAIEEYDGHSDLVRGSFTSNRTTSRFVSYNYNCDNYGDRLIPYTPFVRHKTKYTRPFSRF